MNSVFKSIIAITVFSGVCLNGMNRQTIAQQREYKILARLNLNRIVRASQNLLEKLNLVAGITKETSDEIHEFANDLDDLNRQFNPADFILTN